MRLVEPSAGECADRLTILELKVEFGRLRGIDVSHFEEERRQIMVYLHTTPMVWEMPEYKELQAVNRGLWDLEGGVRHKSEWKQNPQLAVEILETITGLNDRRAELVNKIDGTEAKEKLY